MNYNVVVMIPCRNEERFIRNCLLSVLSQNYPREHLQIVIADGMSTDTTRDIIAELQKTYPQIHLIDNPTRYVPGGLNRIISMYPADVYVRMDAHAEYPSDYITKCIVGLDKHRADNVGGIWVIKPGADTIVAKSIAVAVASPFGVGNVRYRRGVRQPTVVDTVPYGCFRAHVFNEVGKFDERFIRNQDDEFNFRLTQAGKRIVLDPEIQSIYYARRTLGALFRQYYAYGFWKVGILRKHGRLVSVRHLVPACFVFFLGAGLALSWLSRWVGILMGGMIALYAMLSFWFAWQAIASKRSGSVGVVVIAFFVLHVSYGLGFLSALVSFKWRSLHE